MTLFEIPFKIFLSSTAFSDWMVDWVWLEILWSLMGVEFYKEINLVSMTSIYVYLECFQDRNGLLGCHLVSFSGHWNLQILGLIVSKTSVINAIFFSISLTTQAYKFLVPLSIRKELKVAWFKKLINLLESKNYFFTYLHSCFVFDEKKYLFI